MGQPDCVHTSHGSYYLKAWQLTFFCLTHVEDSCAMDVGPRENPKDSWQNSTKIWNRKLILQIKSWIDTQFTLDGYMNKLVYWFYYAFLHVLPLQYILAFRISLEL